MRKNKTVLHRTALPNKAGAATGKTALLPVWLRRHGAPIIFFSCFYMFLLLYINPAMLFSSSGMNIHNYVSAMHAQQTSPQHSSTYTDPWFRRNFILEMTPEYLQGILAASGGFSQLTVTLCIYACHYPLIGALVITGLALFFFWIFSLYLKGICGIRPFLLSFVAPFFIATLCSWYELSYGTFLLPVAGALACAVIFQRLRPAGPMGRTCALSLVFWFAWYCMQWGCLLFLFFAVIHEAFTRKPGGRLVIIAAAANGVMLYCIDTWFLSLNNAIRWNDFTVNFCLPLYIIGFFPLAAILAGAWGRLRRAPQEKITKRAAITRLTMLTCFTITMALWLCTEPVNRDTRTIARTVYHVIHGQWENILHEKTTALFADFPQKAGPLQAFMMHAADHALCRTGGLGDRLFTFPQIGSSDIPLLMLKSTLTFGYVNWIAVMDLAMDLGMVNLAERMAGEIMENMGPLPDIIHRRALIQMAKGNNDAAAVFLHKLAHMPWYRTEAKRLIRIIDKKENYSAEPQVAAMRANMDAVDYFVLTVSEDAMLKHLLQSNPGHKAAYDYLMTYCLLTGRLDGVAVLSPAARALGYTQLPRHWEEALCVLEASNAQRTSSAASYAGLQQETVESFHRFARAWSQLENDPDAAVKLAPQFGDSFFYFSIFRYSRCINLNKHF